ncbi:alpha/beta hydrolase-fold protein [Kineococcus terrestris]|uniref:alpha/beta hydrolase-fold protein n=1 Tax=Kineococcus terrestris TaxID=2044856 RepID=UPI0034DB0B7E
MGGLFVRGGGADARRATRRTVVSGLLGAGALVLGSGFAQPGDVTGPVAAPTGAPEPEQPYDPGPRLPAAEPSHGGVVYETFTSAARGREVTWGHYVPHGFVPVGLPVVVTLHGRGGDARSSFEYLRMQDALEQHVAGGGAPFALASVDGGLTYWHPRADGDDPLRMVTEELLPRLAGLGLDTSRYGVHGISMGGLGALIMAREATAGRLRGDGELVAVAASSPALFPALDWASEGAFDSAADFARWGALASAPGVRGLPMTVSCGSSDKFAGPTATYRSLVRPRPEGGISRGDHTESYFRARFPAQLAFLGSHLGA